MSYASINDVTVTLAKLIESRIQQVDPSAVVTVLGPPNALPDLAGINLYLYRVSPDVHGRNEPTPVRPGGAPATGEVLGLHLHYLLTPLRAAGNLRADGGDPAQTFLGLAMLTLFENPVLAVTDRTRVAGDPEFGAPMASTQSVTVTLSPADDEHNVVHDVFHRLSVLYEVSVVQLTATEQ